MRKTAFHFMEMRATMMMFYMLKQSFQFKQAINFDTHKPICLLAFGVRLNMISYSTVVAKRDTEKGDKGDVKKFFKVLL